MKPRNLNSLIRIEDAIRVLCRKTCHPGAFCPDIYCKEMWAEFDDVERVDAVPVSWIMAQVAERKERGTAFDLNVASTLRTMVKEWKEERDGNG